MCPVIHFPLWSREQYTLPHHPVMVSLLKVAPHRTVVLKLETWGITTPHLTDTCCAPCIHWMSTLVQNITDNNSTSHPFGSNFPSLTSLYNQKMTIMCSLSVAMSVSFPYLPSSPELGTPIYADFVCTARCGNMELFGCYSTCTPPPTLCI